MNDSPQDVEIDREIAVDQPIAHGNDLVPGHPWIRITGLIGKPASSFTDDLHESFQSTCQDFVAFEGVTRFSREGIDRTPGVVEHVSQ